MSGLPTACHASPELTGSEVAQRLHKSRRWLQDYLRKHPYYRLAGRTKIFTEADILRLYEALPCPSSSGLPGKEKRRIGQSVAHTSGFMWSEAQELLASASLTSSSKSGRVRSNVVSLPRKTNQRSWPLPSAT